MRSNATNQPASAWTRRGPTVRRIMDSSITSTALIVIVIMLLLIMVKPGYLSFVNLSSITRTFVITAFIGFSQMIIIAGGGMNVSVGAIGGLSAVAAGGLMDRLGCSPVLSVLAGLAIGVACGLINGLIIIRAGSTGVAFFLTTLATASVFTGISYGVTLGKPYFHLPKPFLSIGYVSFLGIPILFYILVAFAVLLILLFKYFGLGRQILAFGANPKAAELYGVPVKKVVLILNVFSGILCAIAGILTMAKIGAAQPSIGDDWMLLSFTAPLIGGTRLSGGKVSVVGAILGAVVLALISNALVQLNIDVYWNALINGLLILFAVSIDRMRQIRNK